MTDDVTALYLDAARTFADLTTRIRPAQWTEPGLGHWDVRALTGHTSRALVTVLNYLDQPSATEGVTSAEGYLAGIGHQQVDPAAVAERGIQAGHALGEDPAAAVAQRVQQVTDRLATQDLNVVVSTIVGGMRVRNYLPTRTFELVVHSFDIARAAGTTVDFDPAVLTHAAELAARTAIVQGQGAAFLFAVTGRPEAGFSVV